MVERPWCKHIFIQRDLGYGFDGIGTSTKGISIKDEHGWDVRIGRGEPPVVVRATSWKYCPICITPNPQMVRDVIFVVAYPFLLIIDTVIRKLLSPVRWAVEKLRH